MITAQATSAKSSSPEPTRVESLCSTLIYSLLYLEMLDLWPVLQNIMIVNDTSRVVRMMQQLGATTVLLGSSIVLLESIYNCVTHDDRHVMIKIFL